jgi:hypothetical protein
LIWYLIEVQRTERGKPPTSTVFTRVEFNLRLFLKAHQAEHVVDKVFLMRPADKHTPFKCHPRKHVDSKVCFFAYFAKQSCLNRFAWVNFACRQTPEPAFGLAQKSLEKKDVTIRFHKASDDVVSTFEVDRFFKVDHDALLF